MGKRPRNMAQGQVELETWLNTTIIMAPSKSKPKSRSPAPLRTPTTPSQFFPPSYFAAAAGVAYPLNRDDVHPFSSNASYEPARRKSRHGDLGLMESSLLPTLSDTVERMTRPPSQVIQSSPRRPVPPPDCSPSVARTPSQSSSARSEPPVASQTPTIQPASGKQPLLRSPSNAYPEQSPSTTPSSSSSKTNPKSILKSSDQHLQVRQAHDVRHPVDNARKAIPISPESLPIAPTSPKPKIDTSLRTGRARSRTDPGTLPKGSPANHARNTQQPYLHPSGIPRRVGVPPSPATSRTVTVAKMPNSGSETPSVISNQREKRRLFVTNAEISSSSSSECQTPLTRYTKPKMLSRADSQSSTDSQLQPPRFGLGLGLSGVGEPRNTVRLSPGQRWTTKVPGGESLLRRANSPSNKKQQRGSTPKICDRSLSRNARVNSADGQRRRELLMHADVNDSSGCDSQPSSSESSEDQCLVSDGSGNSLQSAFDDSGSEYSPVEEDRHTARTSTRWEIKQEQARSKATSRINSPGDSG